MDAELLSPSHYGSTATDGDERWDVLRFSLHPTMVRLQQSSRQEKQHRLRRSPSHYGSTATVRGVVQKVRLEESLHPTMVRLQPRGLWGSIKALVTSPSHYGSTATLLKKHLAYARKSPSPSHYGSTATEDLSLMLKKHLKRLHPTMVRLQQACRPLP